MQLVIDPSAGWIENLPHVCVLRQMITHALPLSNLTDGRQLAKALACCRAICYGLSNCSIYSSTETGG